MIGLVERVLRERYGEPSIVGRVTLVEYRWNEEYECRRCVLYKLATAQPELEAGPLSLRPVYGDAMGASLLQGSMRVAVVAGPTIYGLYSLSSLQAQPEVRDAERVDPSVEFFMEAAKVRFYGLQGHGL